MAIGPEELKLIELALDEDLGRGDATSRALPEGMTARAFILARQEMVVCGLEVAHRVFEKVDARLSFRALVADGDLVQKDSSIVRVEGPAASIFGAERTALNFLARLSGVATLTREYVTAVAGTRARVSDTRKTTPGWRRLEKYAVRTGGGENHRGDLSEAILLKDNHVSVIGSVGAAIRRARATSPGLPVEVEVSSLEELEAALAERPEAVLLDNMDTARLRDAVARAKGRTLLEVSGGVTLERVRAIAELGVDRISVGRLTHSASAADLSLLVE